MKIAKMVLAYNNFDLVRHVQEIFPDVIVVDNGSDTKYSDYCMRFDSNLGFTKGWNEAIKRVHDDYDAFMLMNSDIDTGPDMFDRIKWVLENRPRLGMVSPYSNSPHRIMHKSSSASLRYVPFVELVCPTITKEAIDKVGYLDESFSLGWGTDLDYGWRVRRGGFAVGVFDLVGINHLEHKSIDLLGREDYFSKASHEQQEGMKKLYGEDWEQKLNSMVALTAVVCNEAHRLPAFFDYHTPLVDEIVVAVQESQDNSLEICKQRCDTVLSTACTGFCESDRGQVSAATDSLWQICLDPDEYLTDEFINVFRELTYKGSYSGYRLARRLFEDGEFRFQGDSHHRFYNKLNAKFLNEMHTEPQSQDWNRVSSFDFISINHIKSLQEIVLDEERCERVIERDYQGHPTYQAKKDLNIHLRHKEQYGTY
jgi:hypothetical protein